MLNTALNPLQNLSQMILEILQSSNLIDNEITYEKCQRSNPILTLKCKLFTTRVFPSRVHHFNFYNE